MVNSDLDNLSQTKMANKYQTEDLAKKKKKKYQTEANSIKATLKCQNGLQRLAMNPNHLPLSYTC